MTLVLAIWNKNKVFMGADGRLNKIAGGIITDKLQKIVIDNNKKVAIASHGNWDFSNGNSIRMVIEDFLNTNPSNSPQVLSNDFNNLMNSKYSFMKTGFIFSGYEDNSPVCYRINEGKVEKAPEIGLCFNSESSVHQQAILKKFENVFLNLFNKKYTDWPFYNDFTDYDFIKLIEETITQVSNDKSISDQIGSSLDIVEISSLGVTLVKNENEIYRKINDIA